MQSNGQYTNSCSKNYCSCVGFIFILLDISDLNQEKCLVFGCHQGPLFGFPEKESVLEKWKVNLKHMIVVSSFVEFFRIYIFYVAVFRLVCYLTKYYAILQGKELANLKICKCHFEKKCFNKWNSLKFNAIPTLQLGK